MTQLITLKYKSRICGYELKQWDDINNCWIVLIQTNNYNNILSYINLWDIKIELSTYKDI